MVRKSRREIETELDEFDVPDGTGPDSIVLTETVVGTEHEDSDLEPGETETTERVVEL